MMGKGVEAGDESVEVMRGIEHGSEVNVVNGVEVVEVGSECDGKEDVHNDGVVTSGEDESDNSYVLVSGSDEMLEDAAERGEGGEVLVELSDPEVVEKYGSKEDEGEELDGGPKTENEEGKSYCVVESGVSLSSEDALERSVGESIQDERKTSMVEEIEIVDKETEQGEVENTSKVENPIEVEYLDKLDDVQEAVDVAPYDHESNSQQVSGGMVDSGVADLELSNSSSEGKLDSEIETTELNISEHSAELEKEGNEDSSLDVKENQECEDPLSSDAPVNSMELQPIEVRCLHNLEDVPETVIVAPYDRESDSQQNISGIVENRDADPEVSTPSSEEKLDSENETGESNESDLIAEELEKESNEESYLDEKVNQEYENLVQNDTRVNSMELELAEDIHVTDESLFDKRVTVDENPQLSEEENALDNKSAVSTDVKESITSDGLVPIDELDFNREEQNESVNILPVESNAAYEALHYEYDDVQSRKVIGAAGNGGSNIDSVPNSDEIGIPEAASAMPKEIIFKSTEQKVDCKTQMLVNDDLTPEAEQTMSKDILVNSFDQEQKESASDIDDGLHSDLRTKRSNGSSSNSIGHDLADDVEVVEFDTYTNDSGVRTTDDDWPELSFYNTKNKINTESKKDEQGSQESENRVSDEIYLADPDRKEVQNVSPVIDNHAGLKKEVVDTSLSEDSEKVFPGSGTSEEIIHSAQSTTWADDNEQTYGVSSPSVLSTCSHSISDGVGSNEVAISESGNKNDETNSHENVEGPKVETFSSSDEASSLAALENEVDERPFFYLIKVPRFDDDDLREQNKFAQQEVDEKTKLRDSYKAPIQTKRDVCMEFNDDLETARLEEKVARDNLKAKRKEIEDAQAVLDKVNNAMTVEEIDGSIRTMEHRIQHETVPLSEEKQLIREIKRLKHFREQLSSSIGTQEELQEALDQKDQIKDHLKILKRDLNLIRSDVQRADTVTRAAKKKCFDKFAELNKLQLEFKAADGIRQEAYMCLVSLRRELARKNKLFWMYKDTEKAANDYALSGDRKALHSLCVNQVETVMDLWNTNNEFRKDYAKCNARSTLRRLKTLDGRSLGLDEEPPSIPFVRSDRIIHSEAVTNSFSQFPSSEESNMYAPYIAEKILKDPVVESVEKEAKKQSKSARAMSEVSTVPSQELTQEAKEEVAKTKEEEELAKKTEENRKKEEEAKMMEQFQLEEKAKAKEALERKKRMAERAQARAKLRAKKEAEQREKEREKRLRRKEKRKDGNENDFIAVHEAQTEVIKETNAAEKHVTVTKRHHRPSDYAKATKTNTMPINLRNRNRRKMQMWVWIIVAALAAIGMVSLWFGLLSSVAEREQFSH